MKEGKASAWLKTLRGYRMSAAEKGALIGCFAAGYIAHLFAFANLIPNADGLSRVSDAQQMTISGRWFLHYATAWNGYVQSPAVIGFFSVLFLSLSAAVTVRLLKIRDPLCGALAGILMAVFPPVMGTFLYMYTASAYFFGLLMAVAGTFLTARFRYGFLPGAILLACAVGTYQAYLSAAVSLSLIHILFYVLDDGRSAKEALRCGARHLAFWILGLALYFGILRLFLRVKDLVLIDYKGISSMGEKLSPGQILPLVIPSYRSFLSFFFKPGGYASYTTVFSAAVNGLLFIAAVILFLHAAAKGSLRKRPGAAAAAACAAVLLPPAMNLCYFMGDTKDILRYSFVFAYLLVPALADRERDGGAGTDRTQDDRGNRVLYTAAVLGCLLISIFYFNVDNLAYTAAATAHRSTQSFATRLVERVEDTPGYASGMEVVIIGAFPDSVYHNDIAVFDMTDAPQDSILALNKHIYYYLNDWLNVPWQEPDEETMQAVSDSSVFQAMPLYPDDGSVVVTDGRVIVKLAAQYRPKQPYEIQYENRR